MRGMHCKLMPELKEYWRGGVEQWECDTMGHLNVRYWMRRFYDSIALFAHDLGFASAFNPNSKTTLIMNQAHVKFIKEAHVGAPLYLVGGPSKYSENGLGYYAEIRHSKSHELAATLNANIDFINSHNSEKLIIPDNIILNAKSKIIDVPNHGAPRSIELSAIQQIGNLDWAREKGFKRIGLMPVRQSHCDCFGRLMPEMFFGFISESVPNLAAHRAVRNEIAKDKTIVTPRIGAAVLENRFDYFSFPKTGEMIEILSGIIDVGDKTRTIQHRIFNVETKETVCLSHAIVVNFDLDTRKAISISPNMRKQVEGVLIKF